MLSLDSPRWNELWHVYGDDASDVPELIRRLEAAETDEAFREALDILWNLVYHQDDVCTAGHALMPHLARLGKVGSVKRRCGCILFIARVETARRMHEQWGNDISVVPDDLAPEYYATLKGLPGLIADCLGEEWDLETALEMAASLVVAKGHADHGVEILRMKWSLSVWCPKCAVLVHIRRSDEVQHAFPCPKCGTSVQIA